MQMANTGIIKEYFEYVKQKEFPCIGAKVALAKQQVKCMVADNMACPKDDEKILQFLYVFVEAYRNAKEMYHSAAIIFNQPAVDSEEIFDELLWKRVQSIANMDAQHYAYDKRVNADPLSPHFSFSICEEAFYVIGLHPASSRQSRRFKYATLVFNPHEQFERLRQSAKYEVMKQAVRKRDVALSGSVNPMLEDFGKSSEVYQYTGRKYDGSWQCPLKINHEQTENNTTT